MVDLSPIPFVITFVVGNVMCLASVASCIDGGTTSPAVYVYGAALIIFSGLLVIAEGSD